MKWIYKKGLLNTQGPVMNDIVHIHFISFVFAIYDPRFHTFVQNIEFHQNEFYFINNSANVKFIIIYICQYEEHTKLLPTLEFF